MENYETPAALALGYGVRTKHKANLYPSMGVTSIVPRELNSHKQPMRGSPRRSSSQDPHLHYLGSAGPADQKAMTDTKPSNK